jgi:hypothetical protein
MKHDCSHRFGTRFHAASRIFMGIAVSAGVASSAAYGADEKKVSLCHIPPGNPANAQTITVSESAVSAHLRHGDELGECATGCRASASLCDDGNACTSDSCGANGECVHEPVNCDDGNVCTIDRCDETTGCTAVADGGATCDDGNECTSADACAGTTCEGQPIAGCCRTGADCDDLDDCTVDACESGFCANEQKDCSVDDRCFAGFCDASGSCTSTAVSCDDSDFCTDDGCDPGTGCTHGATSTPPEASEVSCGDGLDNDCDGAIDTADSDCVGCGDGVVQSSEECETDVDCLAIYGGNPGDFACLPPQHENECLCVATNDV